MKAGPRLGLVFVVVALASAACGGGGSRVAPAMSGVSPVTTQAGEAPPTEPASIPSEPASIPSEPASIPSEPAATPTTTSARATTTTVVERDGIEWEDLENLTLEIAGDTVRLQGGRATRSYGGASASIFTLQNRVAQGDLDGDGHDDVVAYVIERSPGSGVFHFIVPVVDDGGVPVPRKPVPVGDRIIVDGIEVRDGLIEVSLFDRADDEPFTVISRHTTLEIDLSELLPSVRVTSTEPVLDLALPGLERPEVEVRFDAGAVSATESGSIDFRERQTFIVQAAAGQAFTAALEAPFGVWLDVRLDDQVVASAAERSQRVEVELPVSGPWRATVVSSHAGRAQFELTVGVLPLGADPLASRPTPTVRPAVQPVGQPGDVVYLTFDDGPHPVYTPQVLDVLARYGARATFFVIGSQAEAHPDLIRRIAAEGHTIANHTWNHEDLAGLSRASFDETISRTQAVLADLATPCLRPPYASVDALTREWASSHGLSVVMWDASPQDWLRPPAAEIADYIVQWARPGVVMLLHDGGGDRSRTVQGLDMALERLSGEGLEYVPLCL